MEHKDLFDIGQPISGESYFTAIAADLVMVDDYRPFDKSKVWYLNHLFWKHFGLWQQTYKEHYEASLPSGVSESHKTSFVEKTAQKFFRLLCSLEDEVKLPKSINVLEEGPGTGLYARYFLDYMRDWSKQEDKTFYDRIRYTLYDTSAEILKEAQANLLDHSKQVNAATDFPEKNKFLYSRHSNLWDQLPVRLFQNNDAKVSELLVATTLDSRLADYLEKTNSKYKLSDIAEALAGRSLEAIIVDEPLLWKPIIKSIRLESKAVSLSPETLSQIPYPNVFDDLVKLHHNQEFVYSSGVLDNTQRLIKSTDWDLGGYIEIVDIIAPDTKAFDKTRRPLKYDGSLGTVVNGLMVRAYVNACGKHLNLQQIKGLNYTATIRDRSLKALLAGEKPIVIAEVTAGTKENASQIVNRSKALFMQGVDIVSFSDQAFVKSEYLTLKDVAASGVFEQLPSRALLPVLKARTKTSEEIAEITSNLKRQKVGNIFAVTGDPSGDLTDTGLTSLDVIPKVVGDFYVGSVAHPRPDDISKMKAKMEAGTNFFIMQASYDQAEWQQWVTAIKQYGIHKSTPIIATIVPLTSPRVLSVIEGAKDISLADHVAACFKTLDEDHFRTQGLELAKKMVTTYLESGIFSGIYIYSRSPKVVKEMVDFIKTLS